MKREREKQNERREERKKKREVGDGVSRIRSEKLREHQYRED